jgi:hypothetical protein
MESKSMGDLVVEEELLVVVVVEGVAVVVVFLKDLYPLGRRKLGTSSKFMAASVVDVRPGFCVVVVLGVVVDVEGLVVGRGNVKPGGSRSKETSANFIFPNTGGIFSVSEGAAVVVVVEVVLEGGDDEGC